MKMTLPLGLARVFDQASQQTSGHLLFNSYSWMDEEQANPTGVNQILSPNFLPPQFERDVA